MKKKSELKPFLVSLKEVLNYILDFIFPQFCLDCGQEGSLVCQKCLSKLKLLPLDPKPWPGQINNFDACYICLDYQNKFIEKIIKAYKYQYLENLADTLAEILYQQAKNLKLNPGTIISNVPLHQQKRKQRGFDQTEILAKILALKINLAYQPLIARHKKTKTQAQLNKNERGNNLKNAFSPIDKNQKIKNTVLLIDDVATTGATLNAAAKVIRKLGANKIICLVLAKN